MGFDECRAFKAALTRQVGIFQRGIFEDILSVPFFFLEGISLIYRFVFLDQAEVREETKKSVVCPEPLSVC